MLHMYHDKKDEGLALLPIYTDIIIHRAACLIYLLMYTDVTDMIWYQYQYLISASLIKRYADT